MCYNYENGSQLRSMSQLETFFTVEKMYHNWKNGSHLKKCVTIGKMGQSLKMCALAKMGHN